MDRGRSPDPEAGLYYARRRPPSRGVGGAEDYHPPHADPSKHKRFNFSTFMYLRGRVVLMVMAFFAFSTGGSMVMSLLHPPLQDGAGQLLSNGKAAVGGGGHVASELPEPPHHVVRDQLEKERAERQQQQTAASAAAGNANTRLAAALAAKHGKGAVALEAHIEEEEEEGFMKEDGEFLEEEEKEDHEEEEEEDAHIAAMADKLLQPRIRPGLSDLDPRTQRAVADLAREKLLETFKANKDKKNAAGDEAKGLAANAQEAADRVREQQQEQELPPKHPEPRDPALGTHAAVAFAEAQAKLAAEGKTEHERAQWNEVRAAAVKVAIMHAWDAYKQYAWGMDELAPVSKTGLKWFGLGLTLVDSLDLLWLIGEKDEFNGARDWVAKELDVSQEVHVNVFEVTIRVMGGLLSAYHYSKDEVFLTKAQELGRNLRSAMESPSGVPWSDAVLKTRHAFAPATAQDSSVSEATSIQLEFKYLATLLGDEELYRLAEHSMRSVDAARANLPVENHRKALVPMFINANTGQFNRGSTITLGARADSYYEYLLKQWLLTGKQEDFYKDRYMEAVAAIKAELFRHSEPQGKAYIAELGSGSRFSPKMDHLVCYLPGTIALGVHHGLDPEGKEGHMEMAKELMVTCFEFYNETATGLSPEIAYFHTEASDSRESSDLYIQVRDTHNILRPETVESLFYMHRITGEAVYQEWAWQIFQAFEKYSRIESGGYSGLQNVESLESPRIDKMESFFLGETLKYFYLLFADPALFSLDDMVLNTEAHPFPILTPPKDWLEYKGKMEKPVEEQVAEALTVPSSEEEEEESWEEEEGEEEEQQQQEELAALEDEEQDFIAEARMLQEEEGGSEEQ